MTAANSITVTALSLIKAAMQEIGVLAMGETPSLDDSAWILEKLQRLIDKYNARETMVYNVNFKVYTMPANTQPVTIGPGAMFDCNQRPVDIPSISIILQGGQGVEKLMNNRDQDWWAANTIKNLSSSLSTDFYYSPDWGVGNIYFWPISTAAYQVRVQTRLVLSELTAYTDSFTMPPAYWDLIIFDLADSLCPSFKTPATPDLLRKRAEALKAVQVNNISSPRMQSDSPSQSVMGQGRPDFNFLTGLRR